MVYLMPFKYFLLHSLSHLLFIGKLWSLESKLWNTLHTIGILNFINRGQIISHGYDCFTYECVVSCMLTLPLPSRPQMWACIWLAAAAPEPSPWCWAAPSSAWTSACAVCSGVANVDISGYKWISCHWLPFPFAWKMEKSLGVMVETLPNWHFLGKNWCLQGTQFRIDGR